MGWLKRFWCFLAHWHHHHLKPAGMHRYAGWCVKCGRTWTEQD